MNVTMPLLSRKKMPITVGFQLRPVSKGQKFASPHPIQVRVRVSESGQSARESRFGAVWPLDGTGKTIRIDADAWNKLSERGRGLIWEKENDKLDQLESAIKQIYRDQKKIAPPSLSSVRYQIEKNQAPAWEKATGWQVTPVGEIELPEPAPTRQLYAPISEESLLTEVYIAYIIELKLKRGVEKLSPITLGRWQRGLKLLRDWEHQAGKPAPLCHKITLRWLNSYHSWLQTQFGGKCQTKPVSAGQASRFVGKIGEVLQWLVDDELLTHNPVTKKKWPRHPDKEILFLEKEHVQHLFSLSWRGTAGTSLWWFLLMCCTGLDYPDAVAYARDRSSLERIGMAGKKLVGHRLKPPCVAFDVPLLSEVELLFSIHPNGAEVVTAQCINRYTTQIESALGISWRITAKTARKTFGCLMLASGHYVSEVSRMMGHKNTSVTERHYLRVIGTGVDRGRLRVGEVSIIDPLRRIA